VFYGDPNNVFAAADHRHGSAFWHFGRQSAAPIVGSEHAMFVLRSN